LKKLQIGFHTDIMLNDSLMCICKTRHDGPKMRRFNYNKLKLKSKSSVPPI